MILDENLFEDLELIKSKNESLDESKELKEERLSRFDAYKYIEEFLYNILLNPDKEDYLEYEFYKKFINSFNKGKDPSNDGSVLESIYDILEWLYDIEKIDLDDFNKFAIVDIIKKIVKKYKKRKNNVFIKEAKEEDENLFEDINNCFDKSLGESVDSEDLYFKLLHFIDELGYNYEVASQFYQLDDVMSALKALLDRLDKYNKNESLEESYTLNAPFQRKLNKE